MCSEDSMHTLPDQHFEVAISRRLVTSRWATKAVNVNSKGLHYCIEIWKQGVGITTHDHVRDTELCRIVRQT